MHHHASAGDDRRVIPHRDKLPGAAHEDHFGKNPRREPEALIERLPQLHLVLCAKLRPQRGVADGEKRIVHRADAVDLKRREIDSGGLGVASRKVGGV